ncbi:hypothetical protein [Roseospira goensis]|uniref:Uncharacterized protein n=1 Tax=Roseospira goensis TaxID=391922 RepID=A0A7W6RY57_9PROT|nr:hypothetical protein [Roseospira goensis]MBB4285236.1 hypothetical protein [Roseospira goensis]
MRVFLTVILPLLTPSLLYIAWLFLRGRAAPGSAPADGGAGVSVVRRLGDDVPWLTLVLTGALLAVAVTMAMYFFQPMGDPDMEYVPPRFEDGRIIPGEMRPRGAGDPTAPAEQP